MLLPFTPDQFLAVFAAYNLAVGPVQLLAHLLGLGMVLALLRPTRRSNRMVGAGLGHRGTDEGREGEHRAGACHA